MKLLNFLDRDVDWAGARSPRELIVLAGGIALCVAEAMSARPDIGNLLVYVLATVMFGIRAYFARAAAVGACIGALAQQWPHLRAGLHAVDPMTLGLVPLAALALLASSDLVERFERSPSRYRWMPNYWASYTDVQTRTIRWSIYTAGALAGLLDHIIHSTLLLAPPWPRVAMVAIIVCSALLVLGRAIGLLGLWTTCLVVLVLISPHVWSAEQARLDPLHLSHRAFSGGEHYLLAALMLAAATVVMATPFVLRLLRRVLLSDGSLDAE
jgi:hypothetical protein